LKWLITVKLCESWQQISGGPGFEEARKLSRMKSGLQVPLTQIVPMQFFDFLRDTPSRPPGKLTKLYAARKSQAFMFYMIFTFISSLQGGYYIICLKIKSPRS
jgi:hypothetical protein